jgi:hypothetical protein
MQAISASEVLVAARELLADESQKRSAGTRYEQQQVPSLSR